MKIESIQFMSNNQDITEQAKLIFSVRSEDSVYSWKETAVNERGFNAPGVMVTFYSLS